MNNNGKLIGYIRVSTLEQNSDRQLDEIKLDKVFKDKVSGKSIERPALTEMLSYVRDGDTIIVHSMDRLARNLVDLKSIVKDLTSKQIKVKFIKENLEFTGEDSPMSNLLLSVMGAFAEFEKSLIKERQMEGIALAKKKGVYKGRSHALSQDQITEIQNMISQSIPKTVIAKKFNVSRTTIYNTMQGHIF